MKLIHHGMTLELPDDDPRVKVIEALLTGFPVQATEPVPPPPVVAPPPPEEEPAAEPTDWVNVEPWLAFWRAVRPEARAWISGLLAHAPIRMTDVRKHTPIKKYGLASLHAHIAHTARRHGLQPFIEARGYGRARRYSIVAAAAEPLSKYANVVQGRESGI